MTERRRTVLMQEILVDVQRIINLVPDDKLAYVTSPLNDIKMELVELNASIVVEDEEVDE